MTETSTSETTSKTASPVMAHLSELRVRIMWSLLAMVGGSILAYLYVEPIYGFLVQPLADAMGDGGSQRLIYTNLTEAFFTYMKVAMFTGTFLTFPVLATQIWLFMAPGLYASEKKTLLPFLVASPILFFLGGALVYYVILPMAWSFFLSFQSDGSETSLPIVLEARVGEYLDLVMVLIFAFGVCFQLPIVLALLARAGIISAEWLVKKRRYALVIIFIIAAFLTPPDIISQTGLAIPLFLLYELSILFIRHMYKASEIPPVPHA